MVNVSEAKTEELKGYLGQLDETLRAMLSGMNAGVQNVAAMLKQQTTEEAEINGNLFSVAVKLKQEQLERFDELKSDIIRTADNIEEEYRAYVDTVGDAVLSEVSREYVAISEYGTYTGNTETTLSEYNDRIAATASQLETVQTELAAYKSENESRVEMMPDSIMNEVRRGFVSEDEFSTYTDEAESKVTQTAANITEEYRAEIQRLESKSDYTASELGELILDINAYIKRGELESGVYGIEIGRTDSGVRTRFLNDRIQFLQGDTEVAYISDNNLYIMRAEILDYLKLGNTNDGYFTIDVNSNGLTVSCI